MEVYFAFVFKSFTFFEGTSCDEKVDIFIRSGIIIIIKSITRENINKKGKARICVNVSPSKMKQSMISARLVRIGESMSLAWRKERK